MAEQQEIYSFLYKDENIINSLYAQNFGGVVQHSVQKMSESTEGKVKLTIGAKLAILKGDLSGALSHIQSDELLRNIIPHDKAIVDLFSELKKSASATSFYKPGDIMFFDADAFFMPYEDRAKYTKFHFGMNKQQILDNLKATGIDDLSARGELADLVIKKAVGLETEVFAFFQHKNSFNWYFSVLKSGGFAFRPDIFQIMCGAELLNCTVGARYIMNRPPKPTPEQIQKAQAAKGTLTKDIGFARGAARSSKEAIEFMLTNGLEPHGYIETIAVVQRINS